LLVNTVMDRTIIRTYLFADVAPNTADAAPDRKAIEAGRPKGGAVGSEKETSKHCFFVCSFFASQLNPIACLKRDGLPGQARQ
jgi:hypothetical protein